MDKVWIIDVVVFLSCLFDVIEVVKKDIEELGFLGLIVGYVGDGNFYVLMLFLELKRNIVEGVVYCMIDFVLEMEGMVMGEYGVGVVKRDYFEKELG